VVLHSPERLDKGKFFGDAMRFTHETLEAVLNLGFY
jgi:hypothetical protein